MTQITKEAIEAAVEEIRKVRKTPVWDRWTDHDAIGAVLEAALPFLPIAGEGIETATLKERLRAATVARKAAREALEKGFLNRIPDRVFDAVHEASSLPPNLDAADVRSSTLEQKLKVATEALENIQQTRCDHDMGFDREIGPLGCSLGDKCVCVGLCTIASQALLETSALSAPSSPGKDGGQEVEAVAGPIKGIGFDSNGGGFASIRIGDREFSAGEVRRALSAQPASTALVERLTKALEPFAKRAARWDDIPGIYRCHDNVELWQNGNWRCDLTVGDLREARSAIAAAKGESTDADS